MTVRSVLVLFDVPRFSLIRVEMTDFAQLVFVFRALGHHEFTTLRCLAKSVDSLIAGIV